MIFMNCLYQRREILVITSCVPVSKVLHVTKNFPPPTQLAESKMCLKKSRECFYTIVFFFSAAPCRKCRIKPAGMGTSGGESAAMRRRFTLPIGLAHTNIGMTERGMRAALAPVAALYSCCSARRSQHNPARDPVNRLS